MRRQIGLGKFELLHYVKLFRPRMVDKLALRIVNEHLGRAPRL